MGDVAALDEATAGFVAVLDVALGAARELKGIYERAGDSRAEWAQRAGNLIAARREEALAGTLARRGSGTALGLGRFIGDAEWGPEGRSLLAAVHEAERYWREEL